MKTKKELPKEVSSTQKEVSYAQILESNILDYTHHMNTMQIPSKLKEWAAIMRVRHGDTVRVHQNIYKSWLMALMVVRYGETVSYWHERGKQFTMADYKRAMKWQNGNIPVGVHLVDSMNKGSDLCQL